MTEDIFASEITYNRGNLPAYYMSMREYFAAMAMQGMLASEKKIPWAARIAADSVAQADALIQALNESQP